MPKKAFNETKVSTSHFDALQSCNFTKEGKKIYLVEQRYALTIALGSGCGTVGRVVAFDIRGPRFE